MNTIILGDTHGKSFWKYIKDTEQFDRFIFIGDYFDAYQDISGVEQIHNFKEIVEFKKTSEKEVVLLIGNHDHHYFPEIGYTGTSGYQSGVAHNINQVIDENREHLQMAYAFDNILCTHAGVGIQWFTENTPEVATPLSAQYIADAINDVWKYKPKAFCFNGFESSGDNIGQTPIWIRPRSLMKDAKLIAEAGIIQVVGHTQMRRIASHEHTKGQYYLIDCQGTSREYLYVIDNEITIKSF